jgi:quercetin dioxygenase-like cupin family protein
MVQPVVSESSEVEEMDLEGGGKIRWLITHRNGAPNFSMRLIVVPEGSTTPAHKHDYEHEIFIISGRGESVLDGKTSKLGPNSFLFIPGGVFHTIKAKKKMRMICIVPIEAAKKILGP